MSDESSRRSRLAGPALAAFMVLCCLAGPILIGAVGALTAGALLGVAAGAVALLVLCMWVARRLTTGKGC